MSYQPPGSIAIPVADMAMVVGSATPSQGQKVQIINTSIPSDAIGVIIETHSSSSPVDTETKWLSATGSAYLNIATSLLTYIYTVWGASIGESGDSAETLSQGGNGTLIPSSYPHRIRIENYGANLQIYSEDLSTEVGNASIKISVEFITS
jgi:hypothetical protein